MARSYTMDKLIRKHPLQRLESPSRSVSALLHIIGLTSFAFSFKFLQDNPNHINTAYGWHFQYLTIIGLALSTLTFSFALLSDILLSPTLFYIKNLLSITSLPLAFLISLLYWGIRSIDASLVVPPDLELPLSADIGFHATPTVVLLVDLLFFSPPWTVGVLPALGVAGTIAVGYWAWLERCFERNGFYPYPLLELLSVQGRGALFAGSAVAMAACTVCLGWVYGRFNGVRGMGVGERPGKAKGR